MKVSLIPNTKSGRYSIIFMLVVTLINIIAMNLEKIENSNNSFFGNTANYTLIFAGEE